MKPAVAHGRAAGTSAGAAPAVTWLDIEAVAAVTVTAAGRRMPRAAGAWTAASPGEQTIDVRFHEPTALACLRVVCSEGEQSRTQEMTIWASLNRGEQHREVVRQQFTFSPGGATQEVETYTLQLDAVSALQVRIVPSIDGRRAVARVTDLKLASPAATEPALPGVDDE